MLSVLPQESDMPPYIEQHKQFNIFQSKVQHTPKDNTAKQTFHLKSLSINTNYM